MGVPRAADKKWFQRNYKPAILRQQRDGMFLLDPDNDIWEFTVATSPTNGTSGTGAGVTGKGSRLKVVANGIRYINTGTKASPTWTAVGDQESSSG